MKTPLGLCIAGLAIVALPANVAATGITYDCDTAANHYSELNLPAAATSFVVSGKVQFNVPAVSTTYLPIARIEVASSAAPGQSPDAFAGFSMSALPADPNNPSGESTAQALSFSIKGKKDEFLPLSMSTKPGTIQSFTLSYDGSNLSVDLGNETRSFTLKATDPVVRIICSTGEYLFTELTIKPM